VHVEEGRRVQVAFVHSYGGQNCPTFMSIEPPNGGASNEVVCVL
jgi:hypothetical protein